MFVNCSDCPLKENDLFNDSMIRCIGMIPPHSDYQDNMECRFKHDSIRIQDFVNSIGLDVCDYDSIRFVYYGDNGISDYFPSIDVMNEYLRSRNITTTHAYMVYIDKGLHPFHRIPLDGEFPN